MFATAQNDKVVRNLVEELFDARVFLLLEFHHDEGVVPVYLRDPCSIESERSADVTMPARNLDLAINELQGCPHTVSCENTRFPASFRIAVCALRVDNYLL